MKRLTNLFLLLAVISFVSCEQTDLEQINQTTTVDNSRLVLKSTNDFYSTFNALAEMNYNQQMTWLKDSKIEKPLYNNIDSCKDEVMTQMPTAFQLLFNNDMEVQINDTIIVFDKGDLNIKSINGKEEISLIKIGDVQIDTIQPTLQTRAIFNTPINGLGKSFQYEFNIPNNKYKFKYIHEFEGIKVTLIDRQVSNLFLFVKMEYKGKKWHEAGEAKNVYIHLEFAGGMNPVPDFDRSLRNISGDQQFLLQTMTLTPYTEYHRMDITGYIMQEIIGVPSSRKTNNIGGPLVSPEWQ